MSKKRTRPYRTIHSENMSDLNEYIYKLSPEDRAYAEQFYDETYNRGLDNKDNKRPILTGEADKREARLRYDNMYKDAFSITNSTNRLVELTPSQRDVLEAASDDRDWRDAFHAGGRAMALHHILDQTVKEIEIGAVKTITTLSRYYIKMRELEKLANKDERNNGRD